MSQAIITKDSIDFLNDLKHNNDRTWFNDNKKRFTRAQSEMKVFLASLETQMNQVDSIESTKLFRIYRDVRFSKDKSPYKPHFGMSLARTKPLLRGGYYVQIAPAESFIACGFWDPNPKDLQLIRKHLEIDAGPMRAALSSKKIKGTFGTLVGDQVKTAPKGFSKDHENIDLIRYKQFILTRNFKDSEVCSANFVEKIAEAFGSVRPWFDYMSDILTHDLNGVPLY